MSSLFACLIVLNATALDGDDYLFQWCRLVAEQQRAIEDGPAANPSRSSVSTAGYPERRTGPR
jgi:hypothetical protein